jgi:hypothetical protein
MGYYDQMQACLNGHVITDNARQSPQLRKNFCGECGAKTIDNCPNCQAPIKGEYTVDSVMFIGGVTPIPAYCDNCGHPYPWQEAKIENLKEVCREGNLSEEDIAAVEASLPDVLRDTPRTESASLRVGRILKGLGKPVYDVAIKVVSDVASETAKKTLGLS